MERTQALIDFMGYVGNLKQVERAGWPKRGIIDAESVADHSFGTAMLAFLLAKDAGVDPNRAIQMALVHDLAESIVGDITPSDKVSSDEKFRRETEAFRNLCNGIDRGDELFELFMEYETGETAVAKFVKRVDKLEMMFQAHKYGLDQPNVNLQEFWIKILSFDFGRLQGIFDDLETVHNENNLSDTID